MATALSPFGLLFARRLPASRPNINITATPGSSGKTTMSTMSVSGGAGAWAGPATHTWVEGSKSTLRMRMRMRM
jgi:hypothetical protein